MLSEAGSSRDVRIEGSTMRIAIVAGTDFIVARDGRIAAIYFFFDKVPSAGPR
jgi:hypothetical protein